MFIDDLSIAMAKVEVEKAETEAVKAEKAAAEAAVQAARRLGRVFFNLTEC